MVEWFTPAVWFAHPPELLGKKSELIFKDIKTPNSRAKQNIKKQHILFDDKIFYIFVIYC